MDEKKKLKLFISYSHIDEKDIEGFIKHIAPLKTKELIEDLSRAIIFPTPGSLVFPPLL